MKFSENVKRLRLERGMTQEQLAAQLQVSPQAISKWEHDGYPDPELLVPLSHALGTSLDTLFGQAESSLPDTAKRLEQQIRNTAAHDQFTLLRTLCWQMERSLFGHGMDWEDPIHRAESSYILRDRGFTHVANGNAPFFLLCPEPEDGWEGKLGEEEALCSVFAALGDRDTLEVILFLHRQEPHFLFEAEILPDRCRISPESLDKVIENCKRLRLIAEHPVIIDRQTRTLYLARPSHKIIALLLLAKEMDYSGSYCLQADTRMIPLLR